MRWHCRSALILSIAAPLHAQTSGFTAMSADRVQMVGRRIVAVQSANGTEADFSETRIHGTGVIRWTGHAVFSRNGFVLDYTTPTGRRVVSDLSVTRTIELSPQQKTLTSETGASSAPYFGLALLTGTISPSFTSGEEDLADGVCFVTDRRVTYYVDSGGRVARVIYNHQPDISFTNIRAVVMSIAIAKVNAALGP